VRSMSGTVQGAQRCSNGVRLWFGFASRGAASTALGPVVWPAVSCLHMCSRKWGRVELGVVRCGWGSALGLLLHFLAVESGCGVICCCLPAAGGSQSGGSRAAHGAWRGRLPSSLAVV